MDEVNGTIIPVSAFAEAVMLANIEPSQEHSPFLLRAIYALNKNVQAYLLQVKRLPINFLLQNAVSVYDALRALDDEWQHAVRKDTSRYSRVIEIAFNDAYCTWVRAAELINARIDYTRSDTDTEYCSTTYSAFFKVLLDARQLYGTEHQFHEYIETLFKNVDEQLEEKMKAASQDIPVNRRLSITERVRYVW